MFFFKKRVRNAAHLKPLDLPPLKLQLVFQITYTCLLFTDDTAPHSGRLQELHPRHTLLELRDTAGRKVVFSRGMEV